MRFDHHRIQVCKNPEKTRKKKEALFLIEATNLQSGHMQMRDEDDYPVPQVRAPCAPLQPTRLGDVRGKPKSRAPFQQNVENNDSAGALPCVASTSTVLAPIGAKTNYVGPAFLRSRKVGLKRSGSSLEYSRDESENLKKPRSEPSAPSGHGQCPFHFRALSSQVVDSLAAFTARRIPQFRVPFKVPFNTVPVDPQAASKRGGPTCGKSNLSRDSDSALEENHIDLVDDDEGGEEALSCGSDSFLTRVEM